MGVPVYPVTISLVLCNISSFIKLEFLRCMVISPVRGGII